MRGNSSHWEERKHIRLCRAYLAGCLLWIWTVWLTDFESSTVNKDLSTYRSAASASNGPWLGDTDSVLVSNILLNFSVLFGTLHNGQDEWVKQLRHVKDDGEGLIMRYVAFPLICFHSLLAFYFLANSIKSVHFHQMWLKTTTFGDKKKTCDRVNNRL